VRPSGIEIAEAWELSAEIEGLTEAAIRQHRTRLTARSSEVARPQMSTDRGVARRARGFIAPKSPIGEPSSPFAVHRPLASSVRSIIVRAMTGDHAEGLQYHVLPTDDPLRALNILREAAGLQPLSDEHADQGDPSVSP
jgi:hypothetical protein